MQNQTIVIVLIMNVLFLSIAYFYNRRIRHAKIQQQLESIKLNSLLKNMLIGIQKQRGLCSRYINGELKLKGDIEAQITTGDQFIKKLEYQFSAFLDSDTRWMKIRNNWASLKNEMAEFTEDVSFNQHSLLIENIIYLIGNVAHRGQNDSNHLISDVEINIIWESIPNTLEAIGKTRAIGSGVASAGVCTQANKIKLRYLSDEILRNFNMVSNQLNKVSNDDAAKVSVQISDMIDGFIYIIRNTLIDPKSPEIEADSFFKQATEAMDGMSKLFDKMSTLKTRQIERALSL